MRVALTPITMDLDLRLETIGTRSKLMFRGKETQCLGLTGKQKLLSGSAGTYFLLGTLSLHFLLSGIILTALKAGVSLNGSTDIQMETKINDS